MSEASYIIGIDLGTTNSIVAYTEARIEKGKQPEIHVLEIPQLTGPGAIENRMMLPSFILIPGSHEVPEGALRVPWNPDAKTAVGEYARERGAEIPNRLISSSKSWLCNTLVDRNSPILPWNAGDETMKRSPVEAASLILEHVRNGWNHVMAFEDPDLEIENQEILLTVPASFDAVARELTVQAAEMAGLTNITLLEEPQAALYAWIDAGGDHWREYVQKGDRILVCDVGGGTSDFSLIDITEEDGDLVLERVAVGDHLLVGGDNMDLALAYSVAEEMKKEGQKIDNRQMRGLRHGCRKGKELVMADSDLDSFQVTVLGSGKSLIGGTKKKQVLRQTVESTVIEGFFPNCQIGDRPAEAAKVGLKEYGLSYESDPAVTRHLAAFLNRNRTGGSEKLPTAVLFNGGVMKAPPVRRRIMDAISSWSESGSETGIREIESKDFDLSVARGAAYYGLARRGGGIRIRGGLNKSYYIGVAASIPAVPGMPTPIKALCVAPFGMEEGTRVRLEDREFVLVVGEQVKFDFLGSSQRINDTSGAVIDDWEDEIEEISTLETFLDGENGTVVPVFIESAVTEIGTLEIHCVSREDTSMKWKLEFNVRETDHIESSG